MARLENLRPILNQKKFKLYFSTNQKFSLGGVDSPELNDADKIWLKLFNGICSIKESFDLIYTKAYPAEFIRRLNILEAFANLNFFENDTEILNTLKGWHASREGKWTPEKGEKSSGKEFTPEMLVPLLQKTTLFHSCDRKAAERVLHSARLKTFGPDSTIIKTGAIENTFYVLLEGDVGVMTTRHDGRAQLLATLSPLCLFGESSAFFSKPRNADVKGLTSGTLLEINAKKLLDQNTNANFDNFKAIKTRLVINQILSANPLFKGIPSDVFQLFLQKCKMQKFAKESFVLKQGEDSKTFYFILKGSVMVMRDSMPVTSLNEGQFFGEIATLMQQKRNASVVAETDSIFLAIDGRRFIDVLSRNLTLALKIEKEALERVESKETIFSDGTTEIQHTGLMDTFKDFEIDENYFENTATNLDIEFYDFSEENQNPE